MLDSEVQILYETPLGATRGGPLFNAHWYPTKISPESIALMIACHTKPGDTVFDGFGGSCTTAMASLLCSAPPEDLQERARKAGLAPKWGPRKAIVYELTGLGSFIGQTFCSQPDPYEFSQRAQALLEEAERRVGWMYSSHDDTACEGVVRNYIWTELIRCPACQEVATIWDACVSVGPARIADRWKCRKCDQTNTLSVAPRVTEEIYDPILKTRRRAKTRRVARVDGMTGRKHWSRAPSDSDLEKLRQVQDTPLPDSVPIVPLMGKGGEKWGDLWRAGYHEGITHAHHFYTRRNLIALGILHDLIENEKKPVRDALRLWVSSYNSSHSTLMARVVAKQNQPDLVLTSAQPGVLYISGLPVEKNVFYGLRRKIETVKRAFATLKGLKGIAEVVQGSCCSTGLKDNSVDYVFTDPPFGGNIPYSEVNFISEAWLNRTTCTAEEALISPAQEKDVTAYQELLSSAFREIKRILKPKGSVTVVFHSTRANVWRALTHAYTDSGFRVTFSNILHKKQGSFKQVTTSNIAQGDPILLLRPQRLNGKANAATADTVIQDLFESAKRQGDSEESKPQRMYSRFVAYYLRENSSPPLNAHEFYASLARVKAQQ